MYLGITEGHKIQYVKQTEEEKAEWAKVDAQVKYKSAENRSAYSQEKNQQALDKARLKAFKKSKGGKEFISKFQSQLDAGESINIDVEWDKQISKGLTRKIENTDGSVTEIIKASEVKEKPDFNSFADACIEAQSKQEPVARSVKVDIISAEQLEQEVQEQIDMEDNDQIRRINMGEKRLSREDWKNKLIVRHLKDGDEVENVGQDKVDELVELEKQKKLAWAT